MTDQSVLAKVAEVSRRTAPERRRLWVRRVLGCPGLSAAQRNVLLALETFADYHDGTNAHPGEDNLAEICALTTRAVRGALTRGRELGLIERTANENPRAGRASVYRLVLSAGSSDESITGTAVPVNGPITGTAVPVNNFITGTAVPVDNSTTGTATTPSPERPFRPPSQLPIQQEWLRNSGTSPAEPIAESHTPRLSRFCEAHPMGTERKCGDCANARTAFTAWQEREADLDVEISQADTARRRQLRDNCRWCQGTNWIPDTEPAVKCDHQTPPRARRGLSLVPSLPGGAENVRAAQ